MEIREILEKEDWDKYLCSKKLSSFLQSWDWGVFQESLGKRIYRFAQIDFNNNISCSILIISNNLPLSRKYFYVPRGFVSHEEGLKNCVRLTEFLKKVLIVKEPSIFLRVEPALGDFKENQDYLKKNGFVKTQDIQPSKEWVTDITKSEDDILSAMHQKTRYNIRLAAKKGVTIKYAGVDGAETFYKLIQETYKRKKIRTFSKKYFEKMLNSLIGAEFVFAEYQGKVLAASLIYPYGDTLNYLHGASSLEQKNIMAPYLLHWQTILDYKEKGYKYYNWGGYTDSDDKNHPWAGISKFKAGFGGQVISYLGAWDYPFKKTEYNLYKVFRKINRSIKRLS